MEETSRGGIKKIDLRKKNCLQSHKIAKAYLVTKNNDPKTG